MLPDSVPDPFVYYLLSFLVQISVVNLPKFPNPWGLGDGSAVVYLLFPRYRIGILVVLVRFADRGYLLYNVALECAFLL